MACLGRRQGAPELSETRPTETVAKTSEETLGRNLAIATEGGPVVAEVELKPLAIPGELSGPLSEDASAEPDVGFWGRSRLFMSVVVLPMLVASIYLIVIAAPRYTSSASFLVKSTTEQNQDALSTIVRQTGETVASDETYAINAYLTSRDVVDLLAANNELRAILAHPRADFLLRYPTFWLPNDKEFLFQRFQWMVSANVDPVTSISTIEVNAFTPEDAQALTRAMIGYAEALVNQMNARAYQDALATTNGFVAEAQKDVDRAEGDLQAFRNASGSIDPKLVSESKLKVIEGLSTQLAQVEATIAQQAAVTPSSPTLVGLRAQAQSYRSEIEKRKLEIAGSAGSEASKLQTYEQLTLRRDLAAKALAAASAQRDQARQDAERQHLYIQMITQPNLSPDFARYPRVTLDLLGLLALCLAAFQILRKLKEIAAEHRP
jgi:capsular polysaccharide transport system permease protein